MQINGITFKSISSITLLGVTTDSKLTFNPLVPDDHLKVAHTKTNLEVEDFSCRFV